MIPSGPRANRFLTSFHFYASDSIHFFHYSNKPIGGERASIVAIFLFCISQILEFVSKGCPLLEFIDFGLEGTVAEAENAHSPLHVGELAALASLRRLRSAFIHIFIRHDSRRIMPTDKEDLRVSLDALVGQGRLEVSISYRVGVFAREELFLENIICF